MNISSKRIVVFSVFLMGIVLFTMSSFAADAWKFGVVPDTQWKPYDEENNSVAIHIIDAVVAELVRQKVDLVLHVGDLTDHSSQAAFDTAARHFKPLEDAGIRFYPIRGNHDSKTLDAVDQFRKAFPDLPGTPGQPGTCPPLPYIEGLTYAFVHKNVKFIMLDTFPVDDGSDEGIAYKPGLYQPWIDRELEQDDHRHAFVAAHKNLIGQSHKDNIFTSSKNSDKYPRMQNRFFASLQKHGVRYCFSGHDHMYYRSMITSPDGLSRVMQIICGSCCHKFYSPKEPYSSRDEPIVQDLGRVSFLVFTVDGENVSAECFSTEPFGVEPASPKWGVRDRFGYSLDGDAFEDQSEELKRFKRDATVP